MYCSITCYTRSLWYLRGRIWVSVCDMNGTETANEWTARSTCRSTNEKKYGLFHHTAAAKQQHRVRVTCSIRVSHVFYHRICVCTRALANIPTHTPHTVHEAQLTTSRSRRSCVHASTTHHTRTSARSMMFQLPMNARVRVPAHTLYFHT